MLDTIPTQSTHWLGDTIRSISLMSIPTLPLFQYQSCHLYCHGGIHIWATHAILDCYYFSPNAAALRGGGAQPAPSQLRCSSPTGFSMSQYVGCNYSIHSKSALTLSSAIGRSRSRVVRALEYSVHIGFAQIRLKWLDGVGVHWHMA